MGSGSHGSWVAMAFRQEVMGQNKAEESANASQQIPANGGLSDSCLVGQSILLGTLIEKWDRVLAISDLLALKAEASLCNILLCSCSSCTEP